MNNSIHKNAILIFIILLGSFLNLFNFSCYSQPGQWTWIHGSNTGNSPGNYGVQGIPSPNNEPPSVYEPCEWTDLNGNFWFYGGVENFLTSSVISNDLWKYDPQMNEWTWISGTHTVNDPGNFGIRGVASASNHPPSLSYGVISWTDLNGDLWMFGGVNSQSFSSDLWKFNIASNQWTWMKGPGVFNQNGIYGIRTVPDTANFPSSRCETSTSWADNSGNLWFFGGFYMNDLWRYNIASNTWTWMKGSDQAGQLGVWGIKGIEDSLNVPSARLSYSHWVDNSGNFWMFGGLGLDSNGNQDYLQDLWKYNPLTNNWTWMKGSNIDSLSYGHYGTRCISDSLNEPPGRGESRTVWKDSNGNLWMFGGSNFIGDNDSFGDLWKYCSTTNTWTWISGDTIINPNSSYGIKGVPSMTNKPPSRMGSVGWSDNNLHLYLFGGLNINTDFNDLWKFEIDTTCAPCSQIGQIPQPNFTANNSSFCAGTCVIFTNSSQYASTYQWSFPGGIPSSDTTANPPPVCYYNSGNFSVSLTATNNFGSNSTTTNNLITVFPAVQFSPIIQSSDTLFSVPGYSSYQWYHDTTLILSATNYYYVAAQNGDYSIQVTDSNGCFASATLIGVITSVKENSLSQINLDAYYYSGNIYINYLSKISSLMIIDLYSAAGQRIYSLNTSVDPGKNEIVLQRMNLSKGIYFVRVFNEQGAGLNKIIVE